MATNFQNKFESADEKIPFVVRYHVEDVFISLAKVGKKLLIIQFTNKQMKLNTEKGHMLLNTKEEHVLKIGNFCIKNSYSERLFGVNFDCQLKFS